TDPTRSVRFTDGLQSFDELTAPTSPSILWGTYQGGVDAELFLNDSSIGSNPQNSLPADSSNPNGQRDLSTPSFIGQQGSFSGEYWQGQIAEVLVYNALLTPDQQAAVYSYLQEKWTPVPEPASAILLGLGATVLFCIVRKRHG
ncbi:MAG TPA: PEP-CTERM sorting domain-containing protein, partial [Pirellulales bacterium]